jgi:hypothetical protein
MVRPDWLPSGTIYEFVESLRRRGAEDGSIECEFVHFYPTDRDVFVREALAGLVRAGVLPTDSYDIHGWYEAVGHAARYDHGPYRTYIYPEESQLLFALTSIVRPRRTIVLGSYYGYWIHFGLVASRAWNGQAVLVDPDEEVQAVARRNATAYGFTDRVTLVNAP